MGDGQLTLPLWRKNRSSGWMLSGDSSATVVGVIQLRFFVTSCSSAIGSDG